MNFVTYKGPLEKSAFLKIVAQAFEAGDFLNIFLRFSGFWGLFSYKNFSYKKKKRVQTYILIFLKVYSIDIFRSSRS